MTELFPNLPEQRSPIYDELEKEIKKYCADNEVKFYGDYRDQFCDDVLEEVLEKGSVSAIEEAMWEVEINNQDYWWGDCYRDWRKDLMSHLEEFEWGTLDLEAEEDFIDDIVRDNIVFDSSDQLDTMLRNANPKLTFTLFWPEGDTKYEDINVVEVPCFCDGLDDEENDSRIARLKEFIEKPEDIEATYSHQILKVCGTVDFKQLWEYILKHDKLPEFIEIGPQDSDNVLAHSGWNGSGSLGPVKIIKPMRFKYTVCVDSTRRYGVDAVYGMTGAFWSHEVTLVMEDENEENRGT